MNLKYITFRKEAQAADFCLFNNKRTKKAECTRQIGPKVEVNLRGMFHGYFAWRKVWKEAQNFGAIAHR